MTLVHKAKSQSGLVSKTMLVQCLLCLALLGFTAIVILLGIIHYQSPFLPSSIIYEVSETRPWSTGTNFCREDWIKLKEAARAINDSSQDKVLEALTEYCFPPAGAVASPREHLLSRHWSGQHFSPFDRRLQVMLVLRMAFDLPENGQPWERLIRGSWAAKGSDVNSDGSVNLGWPLAWTNGVLFLCAEYEGYAGQPYDPIQEYRHLYKYYGMRDLSKVQLR